MFKKYILCLFLFITATATARAESAQDRKDQSGSSILSSHPCSLDNDTIEKNKILATAAAKIERHTSLAYREPIKNLSKVSIFADRLRKEFNSESAMRDQVADILNELQQNGRNGGTGQGEEYFTRDALYCTHFEAKKIEIVRLPGSTEKNLNLKATIEFKDYYRGGYTRIKLNFEFKVENEVEDGQPYFNSYMTQYPVFIGKETATCEEDDRSGC